MTTATPKIPPAALLEYIKLHLTYDPDTGIISRNGTPIGNFRKKDRRITLVLSYGSLPDGTQLSFTTYAHQVGWYLTHDVWPSKWIDHIDGDGANNRLSNIRLATPGQNSYNQRKVRKATSSKFKGVRKVGGKWRAYMHHKGKMLHLGYHLTEGEAALAHDTKVLEVRGEYARCNFGAVSGEMQQLLLPWG